MNVLDFTMPKYSRIQWVNNEIMERYAPKMSRAVAYAKALEQESVIHGLRDCYTVEVLDSASESFRSFLRTNKMYFRPFNKKRVSETEFEWQGVVSKDKAKADELSSLIQKPFAEQDHQKIGELLGYPTCCAKFYAECMAQNYVDVTWQQSLNATPRTIKKQKDEFIRLNTDTPFETFSMLSSIGLKIIPHQPCSPNCGDSMLIGLKWLRLSSDLKIDIVDLINFLSMPTEWNALKGIAYVSTPIFKVEQSSVTCYPTYIVQREGTAFPNDAPRGLKFPWNELPRPVRKS